MPNIYPVEEPDHFAWQADELNRHRNAINRLDKRNLTGPWITPTLLNSYVAPPSPMIKAQYRTVGDSLEFRGHIDATAATTGTVAFIILEPLWPTHDISFLTDIYNGAAFGVSRCFINSVNGEVKLSWPAV